MPESRHALKNECGIESSASTVLTVNGWRGKLTVLGLAIATIDSIVSLVNGATFHGSIIGGIVLTVILLTVTGRPTKGSSRRVPRGVSKDDDLPS